jgi:hypothetical protein
MSKEGTPQDPLYQLITTLKPGLRGAAPSAKPRSFADILRRDVLTTSGEHVFAVLPLAYGGTMQGVLIVEVGAPDGWAYEMLREAFSASLRSLEE